MPRLVILVDTSVWVAHLRRGSARLAGLLEALQVLGHPWVVGEIAMGTLTDRPEVLGRLSAIPQATVASAAEIATAVERHHWYGRGLGYVDAGLLAATLLTPDARLWTQDRRLAATAADLGVGA